MATTKNRSAFSLLEVLAVVVILGIIAAIVIPRITVSSDTSKQKVNEHTAAALNSAIESYYVDHGEWPSNLSQLVPTYLPDGVPDNPIDDSKYSIDPKTNRVTGNGL